MATGQALLDQMNRTPILPNSLAIWGLGQMGIAVKGPDGMVYIDAYLSDSVREQGSDDWKRAYPPPLQPQQVSNASAILSSHEHGDHLDIGTVAPASKASPDAKLIVTGWSLDMLADADIADDRILVPQAEQPMTIPGTGARLTALPSAHYQVEHDAQKGHRWVGYLIEWNGVVFYHSGDTIIYDGYEEMMRRHPTPDVAMVPVNGRDWYREAVMGAIGNLWGNEAAQLAANLGRGVVIVGHNDMFPKNVIPYASIADAFEQVAPRQPYRVLQPGELFYFVK